LLDYAYLQAKLDARDANALLRDFDAYLSGDDEPVRLVRQAIEMSAHLLDDKSALSHQLYARLFAHRELPEIAALRAQSAPTRLQPLDEPTHHQAGGHLLRTLRGHEGWVKGALQLADGRLLSWDFETLRLWAADGTPIDVIEWDAPPAQLRAWFARHSADWRTFAQAWEQYACAPERDLLAARRGSALSLCCFETGERLAAFYAEGAINTVTFLKGGSVVALGCENGQMIFLRVAL
ncbi:MAG: hypothetical protein ACK4P1_12790, partial [Aggregatilineales bacterium]